MAYHEFPPPARRPHERDPAQVVSADGYPLGQAVWVYQDNQWHRGVVRGISAVAVAVTYRPAGGRGERADTVTAARVAARGTGTGTARADLAGVVLELAPDQWHAMPRGVRLRLRVESVEPGETGAWVWVDGVRHDPDGGPARWRDRVLVRAEALPQPVPRQEDRQ